MAEGLNKVLLLGNLGADPELRITPGGQAVLKLRLATTESYLDKNSVRQERTEWHSVRPHLKTRTTYETDVTTRTYAPFSQKSHARGRWAVCGAHAPSRDLTD